MQGTDRAQRLMQALGDKYEYQVVANRPIAGTNKASEHSFGNAVDIFADSPEMMQQVAGVLDKARGKFGIEVLCWDGYGAKYDKCTTPHLDHVHVDFSPHCGGVVPTGGTDAERIEACNAYQTGQAGAVESGGGILDSLNPFSGFEAGVNRILVVGAGIALGVGALVLLMGDMKIGGISKAIGKVLK